MGPREYEALPPPPSRYNPPAAPQGRRLLRWAWPVLLALLVGAVSGVAIAAAIHVPRVEAMGSFTPSLVTQLLDRNGPAFGTFSVERRGDPNGKQRHPATQNTAQSSRG